MRESTPLRLVIFDLDGTLVDSQRPILAAMRRSFAAMGWPGPPDPEVLGIVGLSLPEAMRTLAPRAAPDEIDGLVTLYKQSYAAVSREADAEAPLYPGARAAIDRLAEAGYLLSIATGKARRGLERVLDAHDLGGCFLATQTADDAPSKPHPGMVLNSLAASGAAPEHTVVIGDTEFDMAMARAAGARALGVGWGYHGPERLHRGGAERILADFDALDDALGAIRV